MVEVQKLLMLFIVGAVDVAVRVTVDVVVVCGDNHDAVFISAAAGFCASGCNFHL